MQKNRPLEMEMMMNSRGYQYSQSSMAVPPSISFHRLPLGEWINPQFVMEPSVAQLPSAIPFLYDHGIVSLNNQAESVKSSLLHFPCHPAAAASMIPRTYPAAADQELRDNEDEEEDDEEPFLSLRPPGQTEAAIKNNCASSSSHPCSYVTDQDDSDDNVTVALQIGLPNSELRECRSEGAGRMMQTCRNLGLLYTKKASVITHVRTCANKSTRESLGKRDESAFVTLDQ